MVREREILGERDMESGIWTERYLDIAQYGYIYILRGERF